MDDYRFLPGLGSFNHSMEFEELEACKTMGITFAEYAELPGTEDWIDPDSPTLSKSHVLAYHRYHNMIPAIRDDLSAREMRRKQRR